MSNFDNRGPDNFVILAVISCKMQVAIAISLNWSKNKFLLCLVSSLSIKNRGYNKTNKPRNTEAYTRLRMPLKLLSR